MPGILEEQTKFSLQSLKRPEVIFAVAVVACLFSAFAWLVHYVHDVGAHHIAVYMFPLFPLSFFVVFGSSFPLLMFISYESDFPKCKPWRPRDYVMLCKRTYGAINKGKVQSKDI